MLRVLKAVGLLNDKNEPTDLYSQFMHIEGGAAVLAAHIRRIYQPLFNATHAPHNESSEKLQNLFNIHSGGGDRALKQQIQTFKALSENTRFDGADPSITPVGVGTASSASAGAVAYAQGSPAININLHIHLPENKSRREYEGMIEDIGRYIFGRPSGTTSDE
jgi:hypothetical protein